MPIIDDFADIAKRMKGEFAPKPMGQAPMPPARPPNTYICIPCLGSGLDPQTLGSNKCPDCLGQGWTPHP